MKQSDDVKDERESKSSSRIVYGDPASNTRRADETFEQWCRRMGEAADKAKADVYFPFGEPSVSRAT